jgi:hypothetical protein
MLAEDIPVVVYQNGGVIVWLLVYIVFYEGKVWEELVLCEFAVFFPLFGVC